MLLVAVWAVFVRRPALSPAIANELPAEQPAAQPTATPPAATATQAEPDATFTPLPTTAPKLLPPELPLRGADAQFDTDFTRHSVPYSEILSGGPPKDGIPAIDEPEFVSVAEADDWLGPKEPVILVVMDDVARAYPVQILMWHEIVNDEVGEVPVTVTYCPLCNTGVAFERTFNGQVLDFGTTGRLRFSNLVMYDRQTETWWQQATGEAIVGEYTGRRLTSVPASLIAWADFKTAYPEGTVLSRDTGFKRAYGRNPYTSYDDPRNSPFLYEGPETPDILSAKAREVTVDLNGEAVAYPYDALSVVRAVNDRVGDEEIVVFWAPGTASALDAGTVAVGKDVGAATTYSRDLDGRLLTFAVDGERIVDEQTGTEWDVLGRAVGGSLAGSQLTPVVSINHFWFSWAAFRPDTRVYRIITPAAGDQPASAEDAAMASELPGDFEIVVYQGHDILGGESVMLSDVLAKGRPVVLNLWAGLCPVCRTEMPDLQEAYEEYGDELLFIAVDIGPFVGLGTDEDAIALLEELKVTFPAGRATDGALVRDFGVFGTPSTLFLKPNGEIVQRWSGLLLRGQLDRFVQKLLKA